VLDVPIQPWRNARSAFAVYTRHERLNCSHLPRQLE
jgi:hypothetical protein